MDNNILRCHVDRFRPDGVFEGGSDQRFRNEILNRMVEPRQM